MFLGISVKLRAQCWATEIRKERARKQFCLSKENVEQGKTRILKMVADRVLAIRARRARDSETLALRISVSEPRETFTRIHSLTR